MIRRLRAAATPAAALMLLLAVAPRATAQTQLDPEVWRRMAERIEPGSRVKIRIRGGDRMTATLVQAGEHELLLQRSARTPVVIQRVPYDAIVSLEKDPGGGVGIGKSILIGVSGGAATFFLLMLWAMASFD
jgi:hypothetical protein